MPVVRVTIMEGYDEETRQRLGRRLSRAVRATIAAPLDGIVVAIEEVKPVNYMRGGLSRQPGAVEPEAGEVVREFLQAMEARDLDKARSFLCDDFAMTFPGGASFTALEDMVAWARPRYRFVKKTYEGFDECLTEAGSTVYCFGTLSGEWPDGSAFEGIRFIDRFEVEGGNLRRQQVWNDLGQQAFS